MSSGKSLPIATLLSLLLALVLCGCAGARHPSTFTRPFTFGQDTFAYANELVWEYHFDDATGQVTHSRPLTPPHYTHHCFVVARAARQFFQHARFDPTRPTADDAACRKLIRRVVALSPRRELPEGGKIVIPGYANLFAFSQAREKLLQEECGGAWQSYFQRGHWRMILPMTRGHQEKMARQLTDSLRRNRPPVVHLVRFPSLDINHAVLLFDARETEREIRFAAYDPNRPAQPVELTYDRAARAFSFPRNFYFAGGRVNVYEIYHALNY